MVYIQCDDSYKFPHHFDVACILYHAIDYSLDYKLITYNDLLSGDYDSHIRHNIFVGSVEFMKEVFSRIGIDEIKLPMYSDRTPRISNWKDTLNSYIENKNRLFVKPSSVKLFTGFVLDDLSLSSATSLNIDSQCEVLIYDVIDNIEAEYRCYIHRGKCIDIRHYSGDISLYPSMEFIETKCSENSSIDFPISYTMDICITSNGENIVIEYNDMWGIGNYGIPNDLYFRLIKSRYYEIVRF